jgi:hypothetical protein
MPVTPWHPATSAAHGGFTGDIGWDNVGNGALEDGLIASCHADNLQVSGIVASGFGFDGSLPPDAVITGVEFVSVREYWGGAGVAEWGSAIVGPFGQSANFATDGDWNDGSGGSSGIEPGNPGVRVARGEGASDTWGVALTRADVVHSSFGYAAAPEMMGTNATVEQDGVYGRVHYTTDHEQVTIHIAASGDDGYRYSQGTGWPPTTSAGDTTSVSVQTERGDFLGTTSASVALLRFDTSALGGDAIVSSAALRVWVKNVDDDGRAISRIVGEWYDPANWPIDADDYTLTTANDAHVGTLLHGLVFMSGAPAYHDFALSNLSSINTTGLTALRLHTDIPPDGVPVDTNWLQFSSINDALELEARLVITYSTGPPPQKARAVATVSAGSWSAVGAATLHEAIDESSPSDAEYMESPDATVGGHEVKVRMDALTDPSVGTGHEVDYRYGKSVAGGDPVNLIVTVYRADGTTAVATETVTGIGAVTTGTLALTGTEADSIPTGDYATGLVVGFKEVKG